MTPVTRLLVLDQNPDLYEQREGKPFVGQAGVLFRNLVESNFPVAYAYVIPHYVRSDDGIPGPALIEEHREALLENILSHRPQVILACGNVALRALTGQGGCTAKRGIPQELRANIKGPLLRAGVPEADLPVVLCSLRPSYVLLLPSQQGLLEEDVHGAIRLCRQLAGEEERLDATYEDGARTNDLRIGCPWTFDIETTGLAYRESNFRTHMIGAWDGEGKVKIITDQEEMKVFGEFLGFGTKHYFQQAIGFNALAFDMPALATIYRTPRRPVHDAMLLAFLADETMPSHGLQACAIRWLGVTPWKDEVTWDWAEGPRTPEEWRVAKQYLARDVLFTAKVWNHLWERTPKHQRMVYQHLLVPAVMSLTRIEETGVMVSRANMAEANEWAEAEIKRTLKIIRDIAADHDLWEFNPNSVPQMRKLLYDKLKYKPPKRKVTKTGPSTDQETLKILAQDQEAFDTCHAILDYRGATKIKSSYLDRYLPLIEADGRLHPDYSVINTETGRTSSWIQQIPRMQRVRRIIVAPEGRKLIVADQSQIELRGMAWRSRDPEMLAVYKEGKYGGDLHTLIATRLINMQQAAKGLPPIIFDKAQHKEERYLSKGVNFGCLYGQEAFGLQAYLFREFGLKVTFHEARFLRDDVFFATFRGLPPYYDEVIERTKGTKEIVSPFGRVRRLPNIAAFDEDLRAEAARQAINTPNQADASDITLIGLNLCLETAPWLDPVMFVHDSNVFEVDEDRVDEAVPIIRDCMEAKALDYIKTYFNIDFDVPLKVDLEIVSEWG